VTVLIRKGTLRLALRSGQWALGAVAVLVLAYCGLIWVNGVRFQKAERRHLEQLLVQQDRREVIDAKNHATTAALAAGGLIGRMEIPSLGLSVIVEEGADEHTLRHAAGHIPGTAQPGQAGNVGISGHRDTFFRPLRKIRQNDLITLTTLLGEYRYRVVSTKIVDPSDVVVLDPSDAEVLTLVTCYPFYFVGPAPHRFIVRAERVRGNVAIVTP
jgi:sortase A